MTLFPTYDLSDESETDAYNRGPDTVVVMPSVLNRKWILSDDFVDDGFDSYRRECVYLVSGLQVFKRK